MNQKSIMIKRNITSMVMQEKSQCLYYTTNHLQAYDLKNEKNIQSLPNTGNAQISISDDNSLLACVHPVGTRSIELVFYHVDRLLIEYKRVRIHTPVSAFKPCISNNNQYVFYCGQDETIWRVASSSADAKSIFKCPENSVIKSMSVKEQGILISVFGRSQNYSDSFVLLLNYNGKVLKKYSLISRISKHAEDIELRNICCSFITDSSFVCLLRINYEGQLYSSLQTVSLSNSEYIYVDDLQYPFCYKFIAHEICISDDLEYLAIGGDEFVNEKHKYIVSVYSLPDFERVFCEYYDFFWSLHFSRVSSVLMICSEKQHFISLP